MPEAGNGCSRAPEERIRLSAIILKICSLRCDAIMLFISGRIGFNTLGDFASGFVKLFTLKSGEKTKGVETLDGAV